MYSQSEEMSMSSICRKVIFQLVQKLQLYVCNQQTGTILNKPLTEPELIQVSHKQ